MTVFVCILAALAAVAALCLGGNPHREVLEERLGPIDKTLGLEDTWSPYFSLGGGFHLKGTRRGRRVSLKLYRDRGKHGVHESGTLRVDVDPRSCVRLAMTPRGLIPDMPLYALLFWLPRIAREEERLRAWGRPVENAEALLPRFGPVRYEKCLKEVVVSPGEVLVRLNKIPDGARMVEIVDAAIALATAASRA